MTDNCFMKDTTATLMISCPDRQGLVAMIANFIYTNGGNIIHADQHTDFATGLFLTRIEWQLTGFRLSREEIAPAFAAIAASFSATWELHFSDTIPRLSLWVTKQDHCLLDLLWRWQAREIHANIPLIISNHEDLHYIAEQFGIEFSYIPVTKDNKVQAETKQLELLKKYQIDLVILAKYM